MGIKKNGITVKSFVEKYEKIATQNLKDKYINDNLKTVAYVGFLMKDSVAKNIVDTTTYKKDENGNKTDIIEVKSSARYLFFTLNVIELYTNLIVDFTKAIDEYDLLVKSGLLPIIMSKLPEQEVAEFKTILDMSFDDVMQNEFSTQAFVTKQVTRISDLVNVLAPALSPIIDKIGEGIDNDD